MLVLPNVPGFKSMRCRRKTSISTTAEPELRCSLQSRYPIQNVVGLEVRIDPYTNNVRYEFIERWRESNQWASYAVSFLGIK